MRMAGRQGGRLGREQDGTQGCHGAQVEVSVSHPRWRGPRGHLALAKCVKTRREKEGKRRNKKEENNEKGDTRGIEKQRRVKNGEWKKREEESSEEKWVGETKDQSRWRVVRKK